jgi:hypothetical protein
MLFVIAQPPPRFMSMAALAETDSPSAAKAGNAVAKDASTRTSFFARSMGGLEKRGEIRKKVRGRQRGGRRQPSKIIRAYGAEKISEFCQLPNLALFLLLATGFA